MPVFKSIATNLLGHERGTAVTLQYTMAKSDLLGPDKSIWDQVIFIHIPKAAGSSIATTGVKRTPGHKPVKFYEKWMPTGKRLEDLDTFAIVRHPETRFISAFNYLKQGGGNPTDKMWAEKWLSRYDTATDLAMDFKNQPKIQTGLHFLPQSHFILSANDKVGVKTLLRFETLDTQWPEFAAPRNLSMTLPHTKRSNSTSMGLSSKARGAIRRIYHSDFSIFGYS